MKKLKPNNILLVLLFILSTIQLEAQTQIGQDILGVPNPSGPSTNSPDNPIGDNGAISISANGSIMAISNVNTIITGTKKGKVTVYDFNGTNWVPLGGDIHSIHRTSGTFGAAVSLSDNGKRLAVSDPSYHLPGKLTGQVQVYELQGSGSTASWTPLGNNIVDLEMFTAGLSVSLSGDGNTLAIKIRDNYRKEYEGLTQVYKLNGTTWEQVGSNILGKKIKKTLFIVSVNGHTTSTEVSLNTDGTKLAVGTHLNDEPGKKEAGRVCMYELQGTGTTATWNKTGEFVGDNKKDLFGKSVSLSDDGNTVVVGAYTYLNTQPGYVKIYNYNGSTWTQKGTTLKDPNNLNGYGFGRSVSINANGNTLAIGARKADPVNGTVHIYKWDGTDWINSSSKITDKSATAVSLNKDGQKVAIGMAEYTIPGPPKKRTGLVQVYKMATNQSPVAYIKSGIVANLDASGNVTISPTNMDNGSSDPDGDPLTLSLSQTNFNCSNIGANLVTLTISDGKGGTDTAMDFIHIEDPIIINNCPSNITLTAAPGDTDIVASYITPTGTSNCSTLIKVEQIAGLASGDSFPIGVTPNLFKITDDNGSVEFCSFNVTVNSAPNVSLSAAGDLIFNDTAGIDNDITLSIDNANYRLSSNTPGYLTANSGTTQDGNDVLIPIASVTGNIQINTGAGSDRLIINFDGGFYSRPITYNGGNPITSPGDSLEFEGSLAITTIAYTALSADSGTVSLSGHSLISYTGLEPIFDYLTADHRVFTYSGKNEGISLNKGTMQDTNIIDSNFSESVEFKNPKKSLTIDATNGTGVNTINVEGLNDFFGANLSIKGGNEDTVTFTQQRITIGSGSLLITGGLVYFNTNFLTSNAGIFKIEAEHLVKLDGSIQTSNGDITVTVNNPINLGDKSGIYRTDDIIISAIGDGKILIGKLD
ncbi:hypothetical protein A9Q86_06970 [Flavobacteriales bacterium 33_180_T64]|nr:hypothetical protein A9Q86_06970 [Flavobacteriales bacterium 33_180_T64]